MMLHYGEGDLDALGEAIAGMLRIGDAIGLNGTLGAGKTSLARAIIRALGFRWDIPSPSFAIIQTYEVPATRLPLWHIDLYRIDHHEEVAELGLEEGRQMAALLVEWPDRIVPPWPDMVQLKIAGEGERRTLTADVPPAWAGRWTLT